MLHRRLIYAKLVQVERNGACSILPRRGLTYAKIIIFSFLSYIYLYDLGKFYT